LAWCVGPAALGNESLAIFLGVANNPVADGNVADFPALADFPQRPLADVEAERGFFGGE
jgi:hypothetical protein